MVFWGVLTMVPKPIEMIKKSALRHTRNLNVVIAEYRVEQSHGTLLL